MHMYMLKIRLKKIRLNYLVPNTIIKQKIKYIVNFNLIRRKKEED